MNEASKNPPPRPKRCSICEAELHGVKLIQHLRDKHHVRALYVGDDGAVWPTDEQAQAAGVAPLILAK
jgi:hypothetical protein